MKIGLWQDLRNPPQWHRPWAEFHQLAIERVELAESAGINTVWLSEHHLFEDGYLSQPGVYAGALAARTSTIRIGTAIMIAPLRPALDIAEQAALVDVLSNGRFELGLGAGYVIPEFAAYGADVDKRFSTMVETMDEVCDLLHNGKLAPPPVQEKLPVWFGALGPKGAYRAGRRGMPLQWLGQEQYVQYMKGLTDAGHPESTARMCGAATMIVSDDPEGTWAEIRDHLKYQWDSYVAYGTAGRTDVGAAALQGMESETDPDTLRSKGPVMIAPGFDVVTPEDCVDRLTRWLDGMPVVEAYFWDSIAGMPEHLVHKHIELLASEVAPKVRHLGIQE